MIVQSNNLPFQLIKSFSCSCSFPFPFPFHALKMLNLLYPIILLLNLQQFSVIIEAAPKLLGNDKLAQDVTWYCTTICEGCGGKAQVNFNIPACLCKVDSTVDDTDVSLMKDMALKIGMTLKIQDGRSNKLSKRSMEEDSEESEDPTTTPPSKKRTLHPLIYKLRSRLLNPLNATQEESIVGRSNIFDMELQHNSLLPSHSIKGLDLGKSSYFGAKDSTRNALSNMRSRIDSLIEKLEVGHPEGRKALAEAEDLNRAFKDLLHKTARKSEGKFDKFGGKFGEGLFPKLKDLVGKGIPKKFQIQSKNKETSENDEEEEKLEAKEDDKKIIVQPEEFMQDSGEDED